MDRRWNESDSTSRILFWYFPHEQWILATIAPVYVGYGTAISEDESFGQDMGGFTQMLLDQRFFGL